MMLVRKATAADAETLASLDAEHATSAGWSREAFESEFKQPQALVLAAEEDGAVVGFICARILPPEAQILNTAVRASKLRCGVAMRMLSGLFASCRAAACTRVTLEVRKSNEAALACYQKVGFRVVGTRPKFYNGTEDAVLMDATLQ